MLCALLPTLILFRDRLHEPGLAPNPGWRVNPGQPISEQTPGWRGVRILRTSSCKHGLA